VAWRSHIVGPADFTISSRRQLLRPWIDIFMRSWPGGVPRRMGMNVGGGREGVGD